MAEIYLGSLMMADCPDTNRFLGLAESWRPRHCGICQSAAIHWLVQLLKLVIKGINIAMETIGDSHGGMDVHKVFSEHVNIGSICR
jgi:hypothetical protein